MCLNEPEAHREYYIIDYILYTHDGHKSKL